jgi:hypothetical protein
MGVSQSSTKVNSGKLTSEQVQANIRQLFQSNASRHDSFTETIGFYDSEYNVNQLQGGNKLVSPQKRYEQFNIESILQQGSGNFNMMSLKPLQTQTQAQTVAANQFTNTNSFALKPLQQNTVTTASTFSSKPAASVKPEYINLTSDKYSEISTDLSEIQMLRDLLKKQTGGCGCSDTKLSATSPQPIQYKTMKGGEMKEEDVKVDEHAEKKKEEEKLDASGNKIHKKPKSKKTDETNEADDLSEEDLNIDDLDMDDEEDDAEEGENDEEENEEESGDQIERLMTLDGSSESSSSSESSTTSGSTTSEGAKRGKKKHGETSSQSGGEINVSPFYSSESRSEHFKSLQTRKRFN